MLSLVLSTLGISSSDKIEPLLGILHSYHNPENIRVDKMEV